MVKAPVKYFVEFGNASRKAQGHVKVEKIDATTSDLQNHFQVPTRSDHHFRNSHFEARSLTIGISLILN